MARRKNTTETTPEEETMTVTDTEEYADVQPEVEEVEVEETETETDLSAFNAAVEAALAERDEHTGDVPEAPLANITSAYRELQGLKAKNAARREVDEAMKQAMNDLDIVLARAYLKITKEALVAATASSGGSARAPADPTESFVQLVAGLRLAVTLAADSAPEGVAEDWADRAKSNVAENEEAARELLAYTLADEPEGDEPEVPSWVGAAVKLALGKSAKVGGARRATSRAVYSGARRNVLKHIEEAFAEAESGEHKLISEIVNYQSNEYGSDSPSAGAVSARLKSEKFSSSVVEPATDESGRFGARKL